MPRASDRERYAVISEFLKLPVTHIPSQYQARNCEGRVPVVVVAVVATRPRAESLLLTIKPRSSAFPGRTEHVAI
jgi:hypothetical protein